MTTQERGEIKKEYYRHFCHRSYSDSDSGVAHDYEVFTPEDEAHLAFVLKVYDQAYQAGQESERGRVTEIISGRAIAVRDEVCIPSATYRELVRPLTPTNERY